MKNKSRYYIVLTLIGWVVYCPILCNQFLNFWDDQWVVINHYTEGGINVQNIWNILTQFYHGQYAPFNEYLYLALYQISHYNPFVFHSASLILHVINGCLVFFVLKKLLFISAKIKQDNVEIISFITALFFCIHPLNVESVAWMSASKVLVYTLFYLLATYTFLLYIEKRKVRFYIYTLLLYVGSFLGKEQAVVFPLFMLLIYWWLNYKLISKEIWAKTLPFFILSLTFGVITIFSQYADGGGFLANKDTYPIWQRAIFAVYSFLEYLFKILCPFNLSYLYPFPSAEGASIPFWLTIYPALLLIIIVSLWQIIKLPPVAFGGMFFTIHIAVALHIIPLSRFAIVADRYAYISVIGIGFLFAYYIVRLYHAVGDKRLRIPIKVLCICYFLYLGIYAHQRTYTWYNVDTLKMELRDLLKQRNDHTLPPKTPIHEN